MNPLSIPAEHGECKHCHVPIIRWPGQVSWGDKWIHNPGKGFRRYRCDGATTIAEPS